MSIAIIKTQIKRELWEHKTGFVYAPVIISFLFLCLFAYVTFAFAEGLTAGNFPFKGNINLHGDSGAGYQIDGKDGDANQKLSSLINDISTGNPDTLRIMFGSILGINFALISIVAAVVLAVYNHGCLFDDRKNRDILFWRSMPVSETTNVLVKLGMLLLAFPLLTLALNLLLTFIVVVGASIFLLLNGVAITGWWLALVKSNALLLSVELFYVSIMWLLAFMPVIGFVLWVSAFAKKSPFLLAALIPVGVVIVDKLLQTYLGVNLQVIDSLSRYSTFLAEMADFFDISKSLSGYRDLLGQMLLAIATGGLFVVAAIWFRNNRYEI